MHANNQINRRFIMVSCKTLPSHLTKTRSILMAIDNHDASTWTLEPNPVV